MPTLVIATHPLSARRRRAVAVRLTRWLSDRGVDATHVIVRFEELEPQAVFVSGFPAGTDASDGAAALPLALVTCYVDPARDGVFRKALVAEIAGALEATEQTNLLYLRFHATHPEDVHTLSRGRLARADERTPVRQTPP
jgi:hypothetical protein